MTDKPKPIEARLRQAWKQQQRFHHLRGLSRFLLWLVFLMVVDFLVDWGIVFRNRLTIQPGLVLLGINVLILSFVLWREWLRHLRRFDPLMVALAIEDLHPELSSRLVSYVQLDGPIKNQPNVSVELIEAMRDQTLLRTQKLNFREIVNFAQLRNLVLAAGCVLLTFGVVSATNQKHLQVFLQRLAGAPTGYPTATQITSVSGDLTVRDGGTTTVTARVKGVVPEKGTLFVRAADDENEKWKELPLGSSGEGSSFKREITKISQDLEYYVRIGDDENGPYRIRVVRAPLITDVQVNLTKPQYLPDPNDKQQKLDFSVPKGSKIRWNLKCDKAVKRLEVRTNITPELQRQFLNATASLLGQSQPLVRVTNASYFATVPDWKKTMPVTIVADILDSNGKKVPVGKNVTFALEAKVRFNYTFHWTEAESGQDFTYVGSRHNVGVTSDLPPTVVLLSTGFGDRITTDKTITLSAEARDDHGLKDAWLVCRVYKPDDNTNESAEKPVAEKRIPIHKFTGYDQASRKFSYAWKVSNDLKDLQPGMQLDLSVEVSDHNPSAKAKSSDSRRFLVMDPIAYLQWIQKKRDEQIAAIRKIRNNELESSKEVKKLKTQKTGKQP